MISEDVIMSWQGKKIGTGFKPVPTLNRYNITLVCLVRWAQREKYPKPLAYLTGLGVDIDFSMGIVSDPPAGTLVLACACLTITLSPSLS